MVDEQAILYDLFKDSHTVVFRLDRNASERARASKWINFAANDIESTLLSNHSQLIRS